MATLKVYRTPIGFHDAYVAAPSQKAALAAWGSDADLFARGVAEQVTDAALTAEPLAHPGEVIRRLRGTADEHLAAAAPKKATKKPETRPKSSFATRAEPKPKPVPKAKAEPRPSREDLDAAEQAIEVSQGLQRRALAALEQEERALAAKRRSLEREQAAETKRLEQARERASDDYDRALQRWRDRADS